MNREGAGWCRCGFREFASRRSQFRTAAGRAPRRQECGGPERLEFGGGMPDTNCAKHIEQQTGEVELKNKIGLREAVV